MRPTRNMQPGELLQHNPLIAKSALAKFHKEVFGWTLYVNILEGSAVYAAESALKTWLFALVRNAARQRSRNLRNRMRLWEAIVSSTKDRRFGIHSRHEHCRCGTSHGGDHWHGTGTLRARQTVSGRLPYSEVSMPENK